MPLLASQASRGVEVLGLVVTLGALPQNVTPGTVVHFTGTVKSDGVGVVADVHVWHAASGTDVASHYSGSNGDFDVPWAVPWTVGSGAWQTTLPCASHEFWAWTEGAEQSNRRSMSVAYPTRIRDLTVPDSVPPNIPFYVSGYLEYQTASGWTPLVNKRVDIRYNGSDFGYDITRDDGYFIKSSGIPTTGSQTITAEFAGSTSLGTTSARLALPGLLPIAVPLIAGTALLVLARR